MYRVFLKKLIDTVVAFLGILVLGLPMVGIAVAIKASSEGPAIFKQQRLGKGRKVFTIYKFRTMVNGAYESGGIAKRSDDPRITRIGAFLRRTSLDELPQLFNILKGEMAVIGPRPILPVEFEEYADNTLYCKRYDVLPGLFCTVDIDYRASSTREMQFEMDAEYIDTMSFANDFKYFFQIIKTVLTGKNVYRVEVGDTTDTK